MRPGNDIPRSFSRLRRGDTGIHITCFVDSITYGAGATGASQPKWKNSWPGRLASLLEARSDATAGTGIVVPWNTLETRPEDDPRLSRSGEVVQIAGAGPSDGPFVGPVGRGMWEVRAGRIEFRPEAPAARFIVYTYGSGTPRLTVDGLDADSVPERLLGAGESEVARWVARGGSVLTVDSIDSRPLVVWGLEGQTAGPRVSRLARDGIGTELLVHDPSDLSGGMPLHIDAVRADLAILLLGANDRGLMSSVFDERVRTAIDRIRGAGGDALLITPPAFDYEDPLIGTPTIEERAEDLRRIAASTGTPLIDLAVEWPSYAAAASRGWFADGVHPSDVGLEVIAQRIVETVLDS